MVFNIQNLVSYLDKISDFSGKASKLLSNFKTDPKYIGILDNTGNIGGLLKFVLTILDEVHKHLQGPEKRAFSQLLQIMIESAECSIDDSNTIKSLDLENEDFIRDLFSSFIENKSDWYPQIYAVDIPVVEQFRNKIIKNLEQNNRDSFLFKDKFEQRISQILELNDSTREEKYPELDNYLKKLEMQRRSADLYEYLQSVQTYAYDKNEIDKKRLHDYYIENDAFVVPIKYWHDTDIKNIPKKKECDIKDFLDNRSSWYAIIGAEFGVGKSSYSKYIASKLADNYIYSMNEYPEYIPILVNLKTPDRIFDRLDFDETIELITRENKTKKILCIYDG